MIPRRTAALVLLLGLASAQAASSPAPAGAASTPPAPAAPQRLRLHRLEARGLAPALVQAVEAKLCEALAEAWAGEVGCPADARAAAELATQEAILGGCTTPDCVRAHDRAAEAGRQVRGRLWRDAGGLRLSLSLAGPDGEAGAAEVALPEDLEALLARLPAAARALLASRR